MVSGCKKVMILFSSELHYKLPLMRNLPNELAFSEKRGEYLL